GVGYDNADRTQMTQQGVRVGCGGSRRTDDVMRQRRGWRCLSGGWLESCFGVRRRWRGQQLRWDGRRAPEALGEIGRADQQTPVLLADRACGRRERASEDHMTAARLDGQLRWNVGPLAPKEGRHEADTIALAPEQFHNHS